MTAAPAKSPVKSPRWRYAAIALLIATNAIAQPTQPPPALPPIADYLSARGRAIEDEIAAIRRNAPDAAPDPLTDLRIDARLVARWMTLNARNAAPGSDAQCAIYMHARAMSDVVARIDALAAAGRPLTPLQHEGARRLHDLTFRLGDVPVFPPDAIEKESGPSKAKPIDVDQPAAEVATDLLPLFGLPTATSLVPMRPSLTKPAATTEPATPDNSIADLAAEARAAAIGVPLRNALGVLADQAQRAADAHHAEEAALLRQALQSAVQTARGLEANTGVSLDQRQATEDALADAVTLLADTRTRSAGTSRLEALDQYRQLAARVAAQRIPQDMAGSLAPAFQWIASHPDDNRLVDAVWKFIDLANAPAPGPMPDAADAMRRCAEELARQFAQQRSAVLAAAGEMASGGSGDAVIERIAQVQRLAEMTQIVSRLPQTLRTLHELHAHPRDGIEQHLWPALTAVALPQPSPARDAADQRLRALDQFAELANAWTANSPPGPGPDDVVPSWTGGAYAGFDAFVRTLLAQSASAFAADAAPGSRAGGAPDPKTIGHLHQAIALRESVDDAARIERSLLQVDSDSPSLAKWADWQCSRLAISGLFDPYRNALSAALSGLPLGSDEPVNNVAVMQKRYAPLVAFVQALPDRARALRDLPDGDATLLSRLATPMQGKPFTVERFITLIIDDCAWAAARPIAATAPPENATAATAQAAELIADRLAAPPAMPPK